MTLRGALVYIRIIWPPHACSQRVSRIRNGASYVQWGSCRSSASHPSSDSTNNFTFG